jgi:hypothetical protein
VTVYFVLSSRHPAHRRQGVSIGLLGAIVASGLGPTGGRVLFLGEEATAEAISSCADGVRTAMLVAAGLAVAGALVSLVRGRQAEQSSTAR